MADFFAILESFLPRYFPCCDATWAVWWQFSRARKLGRPKYRRESRELVSNLAQKHSKLVHIQGIILIGVISFKELSNFLKVLARHWDLLLDLSDFKVVLSGLILDSENGNSPMSCHSSQSIFPFLSLSASSASSRICATIEVSIVLASPIAYTVPRGAPMTRR